MCVNMSMGSVCECVLRWREKEGRKQKTKTEMRGCVKTYMEILFSLVRKSRLTCKKKKQPGTEFSAFWAAVMSFSINQRAVLLSSVPPAPSQKGGEGVTSSIRRQIGTTRLSPPLPSKPVDLRTLCFQLPRGEFLKGERGGETKLKSTHSSLNVKETWWACCRCVSKPLCPSNTL